VAKKLQTIPDINPSWWKDLGDEIADRIRVHTQKGGKNVDGNKFKAYNTKYAHYKSIGGVKTRGKNKGKQRFPRQSSKSERPDLTLTGDMMGGLQVRGATPNGVTIGWSGTNAEKVQWNADMGREITTTKKPLADGIWRFAEKKLDKKVLKNLKAVESTKTIRIG